MNWLEREVEEIGLDEGIVLHAYLDTVGVWTIGVGHTGGVQSGDVITHEYALELLRDDIQEAVEDAKVVCNNFWYNLSEGRKGVMVNMAFNLGRRGLAGFKNTLAFIEQGNYEAAASNMLKSKWARQVKGRAVRLAYRMRTNNYAAR